MLDEYNYCYISESGIISLTLNETFLLELLIQNKGKWTSIEEIIDFIYGGFDSPKKDIAKMRVLISRARKKLNGEFEIRGRKSFGYKIFVRCENEQSKKKKNAT